MHQSAAHAITPVDLLPFGIGAARIRDANLVDAHLRPCNLRGDLRFESEAVLLDGYLLDDLPSKGLVTGLHIAEIQVRSHVRAHGEKVVADRMPIVQNSVGIAAAKPRAKDDVRLARENRRKQPVILGRIVLQIRVLNDHDLRGCVRDAGTQGRALALVHFMADQLDARIHLRQRLKLFPCAVLRTVIHNHKLLHRTLLQHHLDHLGHGGCLVVNRHHGGEAGFDILVGFHFRPSGRLRIAEIWH